MAVVTDLLRTGLTVEQQILVNELVILAAQVQADSDRRAAHAGRMRERRESQCLTVQHKEKVSRTLPKENTTLGFSNENPSRQNGTNPRALGTNPRNQTPRTTARMALFENFWTHFPRKVGKGSARKAYFNALNRATSDEILAGAKRYAASKPDPQYTKHPTTWLNADCWLDEDGKVVSFRASTGPQRTYREQIAEKEKG